MHRSDVTTWLEFELISIWVARPRIRTCTDCIWLPCSSSLVGSASPSPPSLGSPSSPSCSCCCCPCCRCCCCCCCCRCFCCCSSTVARYSVSKSFVSVSIWRMTASASLGYRRVNRGISSLLSAFCMRRLTTCCSSHSFASAWDYASTVADVCTIHLQMQQGVRHTPMSPASAWQNVPQTCS